MARCVVYAGGGASVDVGSREPATAGRADGVPTGSGAAQRAAVSTRRTTVGTTVGDRRHDKVARQQQSQMTH